MPGQIESLTKANTNEERPIESSVRLILIYTCECNRNLISRSFVVLTSHSDSKNVLTLFQAQFIIHGSC